MELINWLDKFSVLINLIGALFLVSGFYYKTRADFEIIRSQIKANHDKFQAEMEEMKNDRKERWSSYETRCSRQESRNDEIMNKLNSMGGDIKEIRNDIIWIKKK